MSVFSHSNYFTSFVFCKKKDDHFLLTCHFSIFTYFRDDETLTLVIDGIKLYFDKSLGSTLLYNVERKQFEDEVQIPEKLPSDMYGIEHLLRLFGMLLNNNNNKDMSFFFPFY